MLQPTLPEKSESGWGSNQVPTYLGQLFTLVSRFCFVIRFSLVSNSYLTSVNVIFRKFDPLPM